MTNDYRTEKTTCMICITTTNMTFLHISAFSLIANNYYIISVGVNQKTICTITASWPSKAGKVSLVGIVRYESKWRLPMAAFVVQSKSEPQDSGYYGSSKTMLLWIMQAYYNFQQQKIED